MPRKPSFSAKFKSKIIDAEWIKSKLTEMNYRTARRLRGPLYEALIKQLFEDNCPFTAKYFQCFIVKERILRKTLIISHFLYQKPELLITVVENMTLAEQAANLRTFDGRFTCLAVLHRTLLFLKPFREQYDWFLSDLHRIIVTITEAHEATDTKTLEIKSKIFCAFANYLSCEAFNYVDCVKYFQKSLDLCRGEYWSAEGLSTTNTAYSSLHEYVAVQMAKALTRYAKIAYSKDDLTLALFLLQQANAGITEVRNFLNVVLLIENYFTRIRILFNASDYVNAQHDVNIVAKYMTKKLGSHFARLNCEYLLLKTQVENELKNQDNNALETYKVSLAISRKHMVKEIEAQALLQMGKIYMKYRVHQDKARHILALSKNVFGEIKDLTSRKIAIYNLAEITAMQHLDELKKLIIESQFNFCSVHKLRKWRDRCVPFWMDDNLSMATTDASFDSMDKEGFEDRLFRTGLISKSARQIRRLDCLLHETYL